MAEELNKWNSPFGFVDAETGKPLMADTSPETLVELAAQRAWAEEITRQELEKEAKSARAARRRQRRRRQV